MGLAPSRTRKALLTVVAVSGFVWLLETKSLDSQHTSPSLLADAVGRTGSSQRLTFAVTAYCKGMITASGAAARRGVAASDPDVLPTGSVVELQLGNARYNGIYTILDTGPAVQGRALDLYMWNCNEALAFGRQRAGVRVLRLGWRPQLETPQLLERLLKRPGGETTAARRASTAAALD